MKDDAVSQLPQRLNSQLPSFQLWITKWVRILDSGSFFNLKIVSVSPGQSYLSQTNLDLRGKNKKNKTISLREVSSTSTESKTSTNETRGGFQVRVEQGNLLPGRREAKYPAPGFRWAWSWEVWWFDSLPIGKTKIGVPLSRRAQKLRKLSRGQEDPGGETGGHWLRRRMDPGITGQGQQGGDFLGSSSSRCVRIPLLPSSSRVALRVRFLLLCTWFVKFTQQWKQFVFLWNTVKKDGVPPPNDSPPAITNKIEFERPGRKGRKGDGARGVWLKSRAFVLIFSFAVARKSASSRNQPTCLRLAHGPATPACPRLPQK